MTLMAVFGVRVIKTAGMADVMSLPVAGLNL
jgi:hypothetical protein